MNIALPRTRSGHKAPYLAALVASLSLLALVAAVAVWQAGDSGASEPTGASRLAALPFVPNPPAIALYIVGSEEQRDLYIAGENAASQERATVGIPDPEERVVILKVATPEDEQIMSEQFEAWLSSGSGVRIFDVRQP
jgi:hypothetical protein